MNGAPSKASENMYDAIDEDGNYQNSREMKANCPNVYPIWYCISSFPAKPPCPTVTAPIVQCIPQLWYLKDKCLERNFCLSSNWQRYSCRPFWTNKCKRLAVTAKEMPSSPQLLWSSAPCTGLEVGALKIYAELFHWLTAWPGPFLPSLKRKPCLITITQPCGLQMKTYSHGWSGWQRISPNWHVKTRGPIPFSHKPILLHWFTEGAPDDSY